MSNYPKMLYKGDQKNFEDSTVHDDIEEQVLRDSGWVDYIDLPERYSVNDGQVLLVACAQQVNNFSVDGNNALVIGAPNALAANGFFKLKYDKLSNTWYRVG